MKVDLQAINRENFRVDPHVIGGKQVWLVQPVHIGAKWSKDTLVFRSSVWDDNGELVSASFPKFFNWSEQPDISPVPTSLKNTTVVEKIDGSTLCVSKWDGEIILRTRGTVDATKLDNGHELEIFKYKYLPRIDVTGLPSTWEVSYLFEWVSPQNKIILNYGDEPEWYLVGIVSHKEYSLDPQWNLDLLAKQIGCPRPPSYSFPSIEDLMKNVEQWKGKEGVVVYSKNDQVLHKIKAFSYLAKHRFKSEATLENTLDLYFQMGKPSYSDFSIQLQTTFDYECFEMVRGYVSQICDAYKQVQQIVNGFEAFVNNTLKPLSNRKAQAEKVLASYAATNRASMIFALLDGKPLSDDHMKKLFWQVLKK